MNQTTRATISAFRDSSLTMFHNFIPSRKTMPGGKGDLPNGLMFREPNRFSKNITSRICRPILDFMIYVCRKRGSPGPNGARTHGIHGFMYYHFWFSGKRLIERPFEEVLQSGKPDFPFCLCWANETWSKRWLGEDKEILIQQDYSEEDFRNHARWLAKAFADKRYIRVDGPPRICHLPLRRDSQKFGSRPIVARRIEQAGCG